jgi:hypothetical protein
MNMRKTIAIGAASLAGVAMLGVGILFAAEKTGIAMPNPMSDLVSVIATKFHLNASDVQKVVDEQRQTMEAQMETKRAEMEKTRLDKAVTDGKITQAQEDLIIAKQAEIKTFTDSLKDKSKADRDAAMKTEMAAIKQWATDHKIPEIFLPLGGGRHGGPGGPKGGMHGGPGNDNGLPPDATSTSSVQ